MRAADRLATDPCVLSQARDDGGDSDERGQAAQRRATARQHGRQPLDAGVWPTRTGLDAHRAMRTRGTSPFPMPSRATATSGPSQRQTGIVRATRGRRRGQRRADAFTHATIVRPALQRRRTPRLESAATQITAASRPPPPSRPRSPFSSAILARLRHVHCHSSRRGLSADASLGQRGPDGRGASPGPKRVRHVFRRGQGFSRPRSPFLFIALTRRAHSSRDFTAGLARRSSGERRGRSTLSARARGWLSS